MSYEIPNRNPHMCGGYDGSPAATAQRHNDNEYRRVWYPRMMFVVYAVMFIVLSLSFAGHG